MLIPLPFVGYYLFRARRARVVFGSFSRYFRPDKGFPFQRVLDQPTRRILLVGDSTAVGTGASRPERTISGLLAVEFPDWSIMVRARNGLFLRQLPPLLKSFQGQVDTTIIIAGGNDILQGTAADKIRDCADSAIFAARRFSKNIILVCQGNLGNVPLFPAGMQRQLEIRSSILRRIYQELSTKHGIALVDLFLESHADKWRADPEQYYSPDLFHPGDQGYLAWYREIKKSVTAPSAAHSS